MAYVVELERGVIHWLWIQCNQTFGYISHAKNKEKVEVDNETPELVCYIV